MKRILFAGIAAAAFCGVPAFAADMPVKAPMTPVFNWSGFYAGGFAGGAWTDHATTSDPCLVGAVCPPGTYNGTFPVTYSLGSSFIGGGTIGVNWQAAGSNFVIGLENEVGFLRLRGTANISGGGDTNAFTKIGDWYDAYTVRLGFASNRSLIYAKIGGVSAGYQTGVVDATPPVTLNTTTSKTLTGLAAGGGWEYAFAPNWSVKAEYLFLGLGKTVNHCGTVLPAAVIDCSSTKTGDVQTAKVGLNYLFSSH